MTTIKVKKETAAKLVDRKVHPRETYDDVIERLLLIEKVTEDFRSHKVIEPIELTCSDKEKEIINNYFPKHEESDSVEYRR